MAFGITATAAPQLATADELPRIELSLKPRLCVLSADEEVCFDELQVRWRADTAMDICLYRDTIEVPLRCWQNAVEGSHQFVLSTTENVAFHLRAPDDALVVSEAFEVIHDQKQYRRQRRNPWSFF